MRLNFLVSLFAALSSQISACYWTSSSKGEVNGSWYNIAWHRFRIFDLAWYLWDRPRRRFSKQWRYCSFPSYCGIDDFDTGQRDRYLLAFSKLDNLIYRFPECITGSLATLEYIEGETQHNYIDVIMTANLEVLKMGPNHFYVGFFYRCTDSIR
jgi:hypothetical protein